MWLRVIDIEKYIKSFKNRGLEWSKAIVIEQPTITINGEDFIRVRQEYEFNQKKFNKILSHNLGLSTGLEFLEKYDISYEICNDCWKEDE